MNDDPAITRTRDLSEQETQATDATAHGGRWVPSAIGHYKILSILGGRDGLRLPSGTGASAMQGCT